MGNRWVRHWRQIPAGRQATGHDASPPACCPEKSRAVVEQKKTKSAPMAKKPSPTKTRTGNALAQFVIISALTVVAYQFIVTRLYASNVQLADADTVGSVGSPSPWTDAALEKHRAKHRASDREAISTTEFSCFMACVGLFGLMQRKKKRSEEEAIEAQRRAVEKRVLRGRDTRTKFQRSDSEDSVQSSPSPSPRSRALARPPVDSFALLPSELQLELLGFLSAEELVECAMVNKSWLSVTGDTSERLWKQIFARDFLERGDRFSGILPHICWRQYYFLHHFSRAVELSRWLDLTEQRKCVVIEGRVYDVTNFLDSHPGGFHVIGDVLGTDATELWDQFQHSTEAKELMKQFAVDDLVLDGNLAGGRSLTKRNLAIVKTRWQQISWCLGHAHLFGPLSDSFLDLGFKFVVWRTTSSTRLRRSEKIQC